MDSTPSETNLLTIITMEWVVIYLIAILAFFYCITRPPRCPRCGKRMEEKYNPDNHVSYDECPHCGHIDITGREDYI